MFTKLCISDMQLIQVSYVRRVPVHYHGGLLDATPYSCQTQSEHANPNLGVWHMQFVCLGCPIHCKHPICHASTAEDPLQKLAALASVQADLLVHNYFLAMMSMAVFPAHCPALLHYR